MKIASTIFNCESYFLYTKVTVVVLSVIIFAILGELYTERGSMLSTAIFVYAATSPINGYAGGGLYARMGGRVWIKQMILSAFMLPLMVCGTAFFINFIAMYYHASRAIPFGSMVCNCVIELDLPVTYTLHPIPINMNQLYVHRLR